MPKHSQLASVIAYSIFGLIIFACIIQFGITYAPFGGSTYVRQSFRASPASSWLGVSDFYPMANLEAGSGLFDNFQERIIKNGVSFLMIHLPNKNKADMKLIIKSKTPPGALLTISDNTGDTYFRILGEDEFHTQLIQSEQYIILTDPQTNILLFQRRGIKNQYTSITDFFSTPPKETIGLYYPPTDQLRFSDSQKISTEILHGKIAPDTLKISLLPDYILSSQATIVKQNELYTTYSLNWDLGKIPIADYSRYTFNLLPRTADTITVKPIIVKLY